ncbi:serine hydrolase FSH [Trichoderma novae-zelandiae]
MKILCLHGRGSNNEIFQAQTAALRSLLDDYAFDFVQGTELHTEGNWSVYTTQFSNLPQYAYYNPLVPSSVVEAEYHLLDLIEQEGGFDGVLGYSGGAAFAAQAIIRHSQRDTSEPLFRFAIFINGGTPIKAFLLSEEKIVEDAADTTALSKELQATYLRPSNMRVRKGDSREKAEKAIESRRKEIKAVQTGMLADGRHFLTEDGKLALTRYGGAEDGALIDMPTLHIRCLEEADPDLGLNLLSLCNPDLVREHHHPFGHDFPRGQDEMRKIAEKITELAELA